jgi:uncharacterized membrane protein YhaH (DUF805 family)
MSGRGAAIVIGGWALLNASLAGLLLGFRHSTVEQATWWAGVAVLLVAVALALRAAAPRVRRLPDASAGTALLAAGLAVATIGAAVGLWAALVGAELVLVAIVLLLRERRG